MSKELKYRPGELHSLRLDENTVALILPVDYAVTVRDVLTFVSGHPFASRRKWTGMVRQALDRLADFPAPNMSDISETVREIRFDDNQVVLP